MRYDMSLCPAVCVCVYIYMNVCVPLKNEIEKRPA